MLTWTTSFTPGGKSAFVTKILSQVAAWPLSWLLSRTVDRNVLPAATEPDELETCSTCKVSDCFLFWPLLVDGVVTVADGVVTVARWRGERRR